MARTKHPGIYLRVNTRKALAARGADIAGNRSNVVNRDLGRLYSLYDRALKEVPIGEREAALITDALNGVQLDIITAPHLWAHVLENMKADKLDNKWSVDGPGLLAKLQKLSPLQALAVADAAEQYWARDRSNSDTMEVIRQAFQVDPS